RAYRCQKQARALCGTSGIGFAGHRSHVETPRPARSVPQRRARQLTRPTREDGNRSMATEIRVPTLGESVTEATIGRWFKQAGDAIAADEPVVELETDKVTIEVPAPAAGTLDEITVKEGETVEVGALLGMIADGKSGAAPSKAAKASDADTAKQEPA